MPKVVPNIPTLNNEQMIELAKSAANAYVSTNEKVKQASITDFLSLYLDVFTVAYSKVEERIEEKNKDMNEGNNFKFDTSGLEDLGVHKIL